MNFKTYWDKINWTTGSCFSDRKVFNMYILVRQHFAEIFIELDNSEFYKSDN